MSALSFGGRLASWRTRNYCATFCNSCKKYHLDNKLGTPFNKL